MAEFEGVSSDSDDEKGKKSHLTCQQQLKRKPAAHLLTENATSVYNSCTPRRLTPTGGKS